jgi:hypothetical protein
VAWLIVADWMTSTARRRPDGGRTTAWLALVSLAVMAGSILWGLFGSTQHGRPAAAAPAMRVEATP